MASSHDRRLILIVGMHRSGTSLLSSILAGLGVTLPGRLIPADAANPEGYHEWDRVVDLQEHLLVELDRWWPAEEGLQPLPEGWLEHHATRRTSRELVELLSSHLQGQGPWAIKDPRTSLLLPLWRLVAAELDLNLQLVLALRHPAEVAASLIQRDGPIVGTDLHRAIGLWLRHTNAVLEDGRGLPLAVVDYGDWFRDGSGQLQRLVHTLGLEEAGPERQHKVLAHIRPELHRQVSTEIELGPRVVDQYSSWVSMARSTDSEALWAATAPTVLTRQCRLSLDELASKPETWPELVNLWAEWPAPIDPGPQALAPKAVVTSNNLSSFEWSFHSWLQRVPLADIDAAKPYPDSQQPHQLILCNRNGLNGRMSSVEYLGINTELPTRGAAYLWLETLRQQDLVWDPHPGRVRLLRQLGINAYLLSATAASNGWLGTDGEKQDMARQASKLLGLPTVEALQVLGINIMALGDGGSRWHSRLPRSIGSIPGFERLEQPTVEHARCAAAWLQAVQRAGIQLIWLGPQERVWSQEGWRALQGNPELLPPQRFLEPVDPAEIQSELKWRMNGRPEPDKPATPQPCWEVVMHWEAPAEIDASVAVCVSLYNYADRIITALESVRQQPEKLSIELVVVDDASEDDGAKRVQAWMDMHALEFRRSLLVRHYSNGGLAAARNTAFSLATAPWCFVLDADNWLEPEAIGSSLAVTIEGGPDLAVVHGLLMLWDEEVGTSAGLVGGGRPWQAGALKNANQIDAMALIRREAWQQVGGYTHIPGGWEDYDFWCCLIDAGYRGVLCPRVLGTYVRHKGSMIHRSTTQQARPISRLLQSRHPWLQLPYANPET